MFVMFVVVVVVCSLFVVRPTDTTLLGEAAPEVKEKGERDTYNVKLILNINFGGDDGAEDGESSDTKKLHEVVDLGVMYDEGRQVVVKGPAGVCHLQQITEAELEAVLADCDPVEAPPGSYTVQPGVGGRLVWLTGPPGMGKSTSAQMLGRDHGYVYYEADCFMSCKNPYVPLDVRDPTLATLRQKGLKGPGTEERKAMLRRTLAVFGDVMAGRDYNMELLLEFYQHLALNIKSEKDRIGGDFAVATVLMNRRVRDHVR